MKTLPTILSLALVVNAAAPDALAVPHRGTRAHRAAQQHPATPPTTADAGAPAPTGPASDPAAVRVVEQLQAFYNRTTDFEADFSQQTHNRLSGQNQVRNGHVRFQRPGRMRWDYTSPAGDVIVSDGVTLWAYEAAAHQAIRSTMSQSQLPSALSFLTGTGQLSHDFTFRTLDPQQMRYPTGFVLDARPLVANPSYEHIAFYIDAHTYQVVRTVIFDAQGNSNRFDFSAPRVNTSPALSTFQWAPPHGTQVVRP